MLNLSTSTTQRTTFLKQKYRRWVWLQLLASTITSLVWLTKLSALYSWSTSKMVINLMFTRSSSVLQMLRLCLKLLDLWFKIIFWAASPRLKMLSLGSMVLHHLSLIKYQQEISIVEMSRTWITLLLLYSTSRLTKLISHTCGSTAVPVIPIK